MVLGLIISWRTTNCAHPHFGSINGLVIFHHSVYNFFVLLLYSHTDSIAVTLALVHGFVLYFFRFFFASITTQYT